MSYNRSNKVYPMLVGTHDKNGPLKKFSQKLHEGTLLFEVDSRKHFWLSPASPPHVAIWTSAKSGPMAPSATLKAYAPVSSNSGVWQGYSPCYLEGLCSAFFQDRRMIRLRRLPPWRIMLSFLPRLEDDKVTFMPFYLAIPWGYERSSICRAACRYSRITRLS